MLSLMASWLCSQALRLHDLLFALHLRDGLLALLTGAERQEPQSMGKAL